MPRFEAAKFKKPKKNWIETIIDRISDGKVLPCIGNQTGNDLLFGSHDELAQFWAEVFEYPEAQNDEFSILSDSNNFTLMTQYHSVMSKADPDLGADERFIKDVYLDFLKEALYQIADPDLLADLKEDVSWKELSVSEIAERLNRPSVESAAENPLMLLAELPLPIYLTTGYHDIMEAALRRAGKSPRSEICYWNERLQGIPSVFELDPDYEPSREEPLVYHLFGQDRHPDSLVLTEDDHLDFLVTVSENHDAIAPRVRQALADSSLILLGYRVRSWDFRVLFRGLITTSATKRRPKSVAIQLLEHDTEKSYLQNYLDQEADFEVYWGDTLSFVQQLHQGWSE